MPGPGNRTRAHLVTIGQQRGAPGRARKWDPAVCDAVIALGREGKFREEWALELGVAPRTFHNWARRYPEFREALELARNQSAAYWSKKVRLAISNPKVRWKLLWEIVTKRFPEYWGPNAPDFLEELDAAELKAKEPTFEEQVKNMTDEELEERLAAIRRAEEEATPSD